MILYEVSVEVRADLCVAFEDYMRGKHIPEIWETASFVHIHFERASPLRYRTCYQAKSIDDYQRYLENHATALRADFMQHFPEGCTPSRDVFEVLQTWG